MKKLLIASTFVLLTGCSTFIDGVMGNYHNYDPVEYDRAVQQVVLARDLERNCDNLEVYKEIILQLRTQSQYHRAYLEGRPHNRRTLDLNDKLLSMIEDTANKEKVSKFFCQERSKNIVKAAEILRASSGEKRE